MTAFRGSSHTNRAMNLALRIGVLPKTTEVILSQLFPGGIGSCGQCTNNDIPVNGGHISFRYLAELTADAIAPGSRPNGF